MSVAPARWAVRLRDRAFNEARRIEDTQHALCASGDRTAPCAEQVAAAADFDAIARLMDKIRADSVIMERLTKGRAA